MKTLTFDFISDPGHGWAKVSFSDLERIVGPHWRSCFSRCSYERGRHAFLEEDDDAPRFVRFCQAAGIEPVFRDASTCTDHESCIRGYDSLRTEPQIPLRQAP